MICYIIDRAYVYIYTCDTRHSRSHNLWPENDYGQT